ncbi:hypothetical protein NCS52_01037800 [Fusarium sp. LHS14.1]|nr:hypothetical protein NCS52_01037800 [Fusarium sp. LHS14.1]
MTDQSERVRAQRIAALESFLKALSDQHLFTSLALTLTIYLLRYDAPGFDAEKVSAYSYCLAVNIALLSSTVHLSATTILRDNFDKFKWLRLVRVTIMVVTIGLLLPQFILTQVIDPSITLQCAVGEAEEAMNSTQDEREVVLTVSFATSAIIIALVCGYARRMLELYSTSFRQSPERWAASAYNTILQLLKAGHQQHLSQETVLYNARESVDVTTSSGMRLHVRVLRIVGSEFRRSFFTELIWLLFYTVFSLFQIVFFINWSFQPGESPISYDWGFEQVLPLVLLGLPVISAIELYYEWESSGPENERSIELQDMRAGSQTNSQDDYLSPGRRERRDVKTFTSLYEKGNFRESGPFVSIHRSDQAVTRSGLRCGGSTRKDESLRDIV